METLASPRMLSCRIERLYLALLALAFLAVCNVRVEENYISPDCRLVSCAKIIYTLGHILVWFAPLVQSSEVSGWHSTECREYHPGTLDQVGKIENFDLKKVFSFGTLHQWCRTFLSSIFYTFWLPYGQNFRFGTFDQDATISLSWYFWPMVWLMVVGGLKRVEQNSLPLFYYDALLSSIFFFFTMFFKNFFCCMCAKNYNNVEHKEEKQLLISP